MSRLWDKGQPLDLLIADYTVGDDPALDQRLLPFDVEGSRAHARMLHAIGVLDGQELAALDVALTDALLAWQTGLFEITAADEDVHTALERHLCLRCGDAGKKIHTGRSRNDQVLTDLRLWQRQAVAECRELLDFAVAAAEAFANRHAGTPLPGYTHLQRAMPSTVASWALLWTTLLRQDVALLEAAGALARHCPLGSAAGYGVPATLPIDRAMTASLLGFDGPLEPPEAAQPSRGKAEAAYVFALSQIATDIGKWAWDLVLYAMEELRFFRLPVSMTTGSSLMPQKRNPDVLELSRAKAAVVRSALQELMAIAGPLPSGYHRDLQLLKAPLFRAHDTTMAMLAIFVKVMDGLQVDAERCQAAMGPELFATEEALRLVGAGVPFRDAYREVGRKFSGSG